MRRSFAALVVILMVSIGAAASAGAHIPDHFDLCVAAGANGPRCGAEVHVAAGRTVQLRGLISGHPGRVTVQRFTRTGWDPVARVLADDQGRVRWSFPVPVGGAQNIFRFRLIKPDHGESRSVRVYRDR